MVLGKIPTRVRVWLLVVSGVALVALMLLHAATLDPAIDGSGYDIVDFELAGGSDQAVRILDAWGADGRAAARDAIAIDYGFLIAYGVFLTIGCGAVATAVDDPRWMVRTGWTATALVPVASLADAVENTALLRVLSGYEGGSTSSWAAAIARSGAVLKFAIVLVGILFIVAGLVRLAIRRWWSG